MRLPDRYEDPRHVANGGMASVWAARDAMLDRTVAVKVLAPGFAADPSASRRFTREARTGARISDHPNVVTVYDIGEFEHQAFIVMEYLPGGTVADRLRSNEPVDRETALRWLHEAARALDAAHAQDIVHRDVKPANLLLDEHDRLAVGDFGIATLATETALTQPGTVLGTAAYISPEQALGQQATAASDRYSLAVVAYELLTGARPFAAAGAAAQARAHADDAPLPATNAAPELPPAVDAVFARALAKAPEDRPESATAMVDDLERSLGDATEATRAMAPVAPAPVTREPTPAPPTPPPPPTPRPTATPPHDSRRRILAAAVLAAAAMALVLALVAGGDDSGTTDSQTASTSTPRKATATQAPKTTSTQADTQPAPTQAQGQSPAQLNDAGFAKLPGDPQGAIPLLQQSVEGYRKAGDRSSLGYAYALFNLGNALRLAGRPAEAIPYLEERLAVSDNQRGTVEKELQAAQEAAGVEPTKPGKAKGKDKKD